MAVAHLPRHEPVHPSVQPSGRCESCGCSFWVRHRRVRNLDESPHYPRHQADRINADGRLHLTTCLPEAQLERLGPPEAA